MKSISIRKAAAVAAGTALLIGAALAVVPDAAKNKAFYWDATGNTNVQIVTGSNAMIADGVNAAKLAAVIGGKAYTTSGGTETPAAAGTVKIGVMGGASALPEESVRNDYAWNVIGSDLVMGSSKGLQKGTVSFNSDEFDYEEEVFVDGTAGVTFQYREGTDYHGMGFANTKPNMMEYRFKFLDAFPDPNGNLNSTVEIKFLGETYVLNKLKQTEAELVKGEKISLGIGQSTDVTVGGKTYTVTLDSASLDETTTPNTGYATITVSGGDLTSPASVQLDTDSTQSTTMSGFFAYLQSVQKSYTPGQGGSATLRVGGDVLILKDGAAPAAFPNWKASITANAAGSITEIALVYNVNLQAKDVTDTVTGPNSYFQVKYVGDEVARAQWAAETIKVGTTDTDDRAIDTLTYTDFGYDDTYEIELNDDANQTAFLASNATVGSIGNTTVAGAFNGFTTLVEDDIFFVYNTPVKISTMTTSLTAANAQVTFDVGYGGSNPTTKTIKASECGAASAAAVSLVACPAFDMLGGYQISYNWTWNNTAGIPYMNVYAGADNDIDTKYGTIVFGTNGTDTNSTFRTHVGPGLVNFTDKQAALWNIQFVNTTTDPGMNASVNAVQVINQATSTASNDDNKFAYTNGAWAEALDTQTIQFTNPENAPRTMRIAIIRGSVEGEAGESVTTISTTDTFPYTVTSDVTVKEMACTADAVATGVKFGTISDNLVVTDTVDPTGNAIVIGGHYVNRLAVGMTEGTLTAAGTKMIEMSTKTLYVAGYTAADTTAAVGELILAIKAL